ncbi:hypothetical protein KGV55_00485 [Candidatus Gracilibacteria bacterium]|nr:hypothetical protein [Candidatus Gracilibacteria bacterium]
MKIREFEVLGCTTIDQAIEQMINAADKETTLISELSSVYVIVNYNSEKRLILRDWHRAAKGFIGNSVGPYPKAQLSAEELANDARIEAENEEWKKAKKRINLNRKIESCPPMEKNKEEWSNLLKQHKDKDFILNIFKYAENWARLMQLEISKGKKLSEIAESTSKEVNINGISEFEHSYAVLILSDTWKYGEDLINILKSSHLQQTK